MGVHSRELVLAVVGGAVVIITAITWNKIRQKRNRIPQEWKEIGVVERLWLYPLKSGRPIELETAECTPTGLVTREEGKLSLQDRGMLVYHEDNSEQRGAKHHPKVVLIKVTATGEDEILFEAPDTAPLRVKISPDDEKLVPCSLWGGEPQQCYDCGDEVAGWISQYCLQKDHGLRVGWHSNAKRNISTTPWNEMTSFYKKIRNEDIGIYADLMSYMIFNQASVDDLRAQLPDVVSALNFRPNIVVRGPEPYEEDQWEWIKIGDEVVFRNVKPCTRCTVINLDPESAVPAPQNRILRKLQEYRKVKDPTQHKIEGDSPMLGVYAGIYVLGHIKLGDKVYIGV